jgi:ribosomal protein L5
MMNIKYHQTLVIEKNILTLRLIIIFFFWSESVTINNYPSPELKYTDFLAPLSDHGPENMKKKRTLGTWKMRTPIVIAIKITPLAIKLRGNLKDYAVFS